MRLLNAGGTQTLEDHADEIALVVTATVVLLAVIDPDQLIVFVDTEHPMRRQVLHRERTGKADRSPDLIGLVGEALEVRLGGGAGIDLALASNACFPEVGKRLLRRFMPARGSFPWHLPVHKLIGRHQLAARHLEGLAIKGVDVHRLALPAPVLTLDGMACPCSAALSRSTAACTCGCHCS